MQTIKRIILGIVLFVAVIVVVVFLLTLGIILLIRERRIVRDRHEWLAVMSHYEWIGLDEVLKEMRKRKKTKSLLLVTMSVDIARLAIEGLIELRRVKETFVLVFIIEKMMKVDTRACYHCHISCSKMHYEPD